MLEWHYFGDSAYDGLSACFDPSGYGNGCLFVFDLMLYTSEMLTTQTLDLYSRKTGGSCRLLSIFDWKERAGRVSATQMITTLDYQVLAKQAFRENKSICYELANMCAPRRRLKPNIACTSYTPLATVKNRGIGCISCYTYFSNIKPQ